MGASLAETRCRGVQDDGDAVARGQALGPTLTEVGASLAETRRREVRRWDPL